MLAYVMLWLAVGAQAVASGPALTGDEAVRFLREADVVRVEHFKSLGITKPQRAILSDGELTMRAVFKDCHVLEMVKMNRRGERVTRFRDSYLNEAAAYELSEMLGLHLVPPTVVRKVGWRPGSLQCWVENAISEADRVDRHIRPVDPVGWSRQMAALKAFVQLTADMDYKNINNILVDSEFRIYKIDNSRAFQWTSALHDPEDLDRFPRIMIERLRALEPETLRTRLAPYLEEGRIEALWARCEAMVALADERVAERGAEGVLFEW